MELAAAYAIRILANEANGEGKFLEKRKRLKADASLGELAAMVNPMQIPVEARFLISYLQKGLYIPALCMGVGKEV